MPDYEIRTIDGLPATTPLRTIVDLASCLSPDDLELALDSILRRGSPGPRTISCYLDEFGRGRRGTGKLRKLVDGYLAKESNDSVLETKFLQLVRRANLPVPESQFRVMIDGRVLRRADFAYPERKILIELDGYDPHSGRSAFQADRQKDNKVSIVGWLVLRFTWYDVTQRPDYVVHQLRLALGHQTFDL